MTSGAVVAGAWVLLSVFAVVIIGRNAWRGWRDDSTQARKWRTNKVIGSFMGIIGIITAMVAFEKTIRELNQDSERYVLESFLELKFDTTKAAAIACAVDQSSQQSKNECFDFTNIYTQFEIYMLHSDAHFHIPINWQHNLRLYPL